MDSSSRQTSCTIFFGAHGIGGDERGAEADGSRGAHEDGGL